MQRSMHCFFLNAFLRSREEEDQSSELVSKGTYFWMVDISKQQAGKGKYQHWKTFAALAFF